MATQIGQAGSSLDLRLGLNPSIQNPKYAAEFQLIYNALHLLGEYMDVLRANLESTPGQTPSESVRFRRTFWAPAAQTITAGSIVSPTAGGIVNGILSSEPKVSSYTDSAPLGASTTNRAVLGVDLRMFGVALTSAVPGELVNVGIGPGITQVAGAVCGQLIWGVDSRSIRSTAPSASPTRTFQGRDLVGNGGVYLANITGSYAVSGATYHWEGYWLPGYPQVNPSGGTSIYNSAYLYPIGVCVIDGYVMFSDFKRSDSIPQVTFP
ncbi:MAG: hypothetical protein [Bacteriophage sp.]|nr:MAG: hypothetical protein [Bacteriophage sp.]